MKIVIFLFFLIWCYRSEMTEKKWEKSFGCSSKRCVCVQISCVTDTSISKLDTNLPLAVRDSVYIYIFDLFCDVALVCMNKQLKCIIADHWDLVENHFDWKWNQIKINYRRIHALSVDYYRKSCFCGRYRYSKMAIAKCWNWKIFVSLWRRINRRYLVIE